MLYLLKLCTLTKVNRQENTYFLDYAFKTNVAVPQILYAVYFFWNGGMK